MPIPLSICLFFYIFICLHTYINMPTFFTYLYAYISICTYVPVLTLRYNRIEKCADTI